MSQSHGKPPAPAAKPGVNVRQQSLPRTRHWLLTHSLRVGVSISVCAHGLLPLLGFALPDPGIKKHRDRGLDVVLVNARHARAPVDAQALAQANLDGGGEQANRKLMPSSPLPPQAAAQDGDALLDAQQKAQALEAKQREMLALAKSNAPAVNTERSRDMAEQTPDTTPSPQGLDISRARAIASQEAVVDKLLQDYAARPKKGFISPRTREYRLAQYGEDWRLKVQRVGELNFPRNASGSLYGSVLVSVELAPDGHVLSTEIRRPDPNPKINDAALRIIRLAAPYAPFPPDIRKDFDVLVLTRTLNFTREDINVGAQ